MFGIHLVAMETLSRNVGYGHQLGTLPLPLATSWMIFSRKDLIHSPGALIFTTAAKGMPPDCLALLARGAYAVIPQDCIYLNNLKSCCLWIWLSISLNLGAEILPLGTLTGLGASSPTGSY